MLGADPAWGKLPKRHLVTPLHALMLAEQAQSSSQPCPSPLCLFACSHPAALSSRCPHLFVQQRVAVLVQLLVLLGTRDPHSPRAQLGSARPTHKPSRRSDPKRQCHRPRAARKQLSPAGKAASASAVCEHKQLLGARSETPAWAVQLPDPASERNESRRMAERKLPGGKGSALRHEPVPAPRRGARLGCREKRSICQAHWGPCHETLMWLLTSWNLLRCSGGDEGCSLPVHSLYVELVQLGLLLC